MSGTDDTSKVEHAILADTELNAASGGIWFMGYARGTSPSVSEIVVTKQQDCASTGLF